MTFKNETTAYGGDYAAQVRQAELAYRDKLSEDMFNLGAQAFAKQKSDDMTAFNPAAWVAWMRKCEVAIRGTNVYVGMKSPQHWWLEKTAEHLDFWLNRVYYPKKVYYAMNGSILALGKHQIEKEDFDTQEVLRQVIARSESGQI